MLFNIDDGDHRNRIDDDDGDDSIDVETADDDDSRDNILGVATKGVIASLIFFLIILLTVATVGAMIMVFRSSSLSYLRR